MKKILFYLLAGATLLTSCQRDDTIPASKSDTKVTITARVPAQPAVQKSSRAAGDGTQVNRCVLEVYLQGVLADRQTAAVTGLGASFDLRLVASQAYDFVLWADHVADPATEAGLAADLHYNTADLRAVSMLGDYAGNDETRDAFTASEHFVVDAAFNKSIELKRPFAQLNIATRDAQFSQLEAFRPAKAHLAFTGVYTTYNSLTGAVGGEQPMTYASGVTPTDIASGKLTTDYLFAPASPDQKLTDMVLTLYNSQNEVLTANDRLTNIPLLRNKRTNVSGNLMTVGARIDVTVNPILDGDIAHEIVEVADISEVNKALEDGALSIRVTKPLDKGAAEIVIPAAYEQGATVSLEIPVTMDAQLTLSQATAGDPAKQAPEALVLTTSTTVPSYLTIDMPQTTVTVNGAFYELEASTADNTLIIAPDASVGDLTLKKGSVRIYGSVQGKIVKQAGWTGEVIHCVTSQQELENAIRDEAEYGIAYDYILIDKSVTGLDGKDAAITKRVVFKASADLSNLTLNPASGNAVTLAADRIDVRLRNVTINQLTANSNANLNGAVFASGYNDLKLALDGCNLIVPKANQRGINILGATDANSLCIVTLDNTHIGPAAERLQTDYTTDAYTTEQRTAFVGRTNAQAVSVGKHEGKTVVNISNSVLEGAAYVVNLRQFASVNSYEVNVNNSVLDGRSAFNIWTEGKGGRINVSNNSKLVGRNYFEGPTEVFATIVVNEDSAGAATNNIIDITDSEIHCFNDPMSNTNWQYAADIRSSTANTLRLKGSTKIVDHSGRLPYAVQIAHKSSTTFQADPTVTIEGAAAGATITNLTPWDGVSVSAPSVDGDGDYPINTAAELAWIAKEMNAGNTFYLPAKKRYAEIYLQSDIDLNGKPWLVKTAKNITFNGLSHTIDNLSVENTQNAGFFCDAISVTIKDLTLRNARVKALDDGNQNAYAGGFIGRCYGAVKLENCTLEKGEISGINKVGGILGFNAENAATITGCTVKGSVVRTDDTKSEHGQCGGILGYVGSVFGGTTLVNDCNVVDTKVEAASNTTDTYRTNSIFVGSFQGTAGDNLTISAGADAVRNSTLNGAAPIVAKYAGLLGGVRNTATLGTTTVLTINGTRYTE